MKRFFIFAAMFLIFGLATGLPAEIEFFAELEAVSGNGSAGFVDLTMILTSSFTMNVRATNATEIKDDNGLDIPLGDLVNYVGATLKIEGYFTASGILAQEIEVNEDTQHFEIKGVIEEISDPQITLLGMPVTVADSAQIKHVDGTPLTFGDLEVGQFVKVEGMVEGDSMVAYEIKVGVPANGYARVNFEGIIEQIDIEEGEPSLLHVRTLGGRIAMVLITDDTDIKGTPAVGVRIKVIGVLNEELQVVARKIMVKRLFFVAPDELEMGFNQIHQIQVMLAVPLSEDLVVSIISLDPGIAGPDVPELTIPAGEITRSFGVGSFEIEGETGIEVTIVSPATMAGMTETVEVEVEEDADDDDDGETNINVQWTPNKINMAPGQFRLSHIRLNQPFPEDLVAKLELADGVLTDLVFPPEVLIPAGVRLVEVLVESVEISGRDEIRATLYDAEENIIGGDELKVDVKGTPHGNLEIDWQPDGIELEEMEATRTVTLKLNHPVPPHTKVFLTLTEGEEGVLLFPAEVSFDPGSKELRVTIELIVMPSGDEEYKIRAALPFQSGGDSAILEVEIGG